MEPQPEKNGEFSEMLDALKQQFTSYMGTCYELYSLKIVQKISRGGTGLLIGGFICLFALLLLLFASAGTAMLINEKMASTYAGYFIVAGFYAMLVLVVYIFRKGWIRKTIQDSIICELLKD